MIFSYIQANQDLKPQLICDHLQEVKITLNMRSLTSGINRIRSLKLISAGGPQTALYSSKLET